MGSNLITKTFLPYLKENFHFMSEYNSQIFLNVTQAKIMFLNLQLLLECVLLLKLLFFLFQFLRFSFKHN